MNYFLNYPFIFRMYYTSYSDDMKCFIHKLLTFVALFTSSSSSSASSPNDSRLKFLQGIREPSHILTETIMYNNLKRNP